MANLEKASSGKSRERQLILDLYRRRMIGTADLDSQLEKMASEEKELLSRVAALRRQTEQGEQSAKSLSSASQLLRELSIRLDGPLPWASKRQLVEMLVDSIVVETESDSGLKRAKVTVKYRFTKAENFTGRGSSPRSA